jgi:tetratricopeptide (TPR) repeat protein
MSNTPEKPFGEVEASLEKTGRVDELIKLYESRSREVPQAEEAAHLLCRAADLCREKLKNPVRAEEMLRRALVYAPNAREALEGLRVIYEGRNDFGALAEVLERLALVQGGPAAAAIYLRAGELYEAKLQRRDRAVLCFQLASRASPQERQAYQKARRLLLQEGRHASAYDSLERERAALGDRELIEEYVSFAESLVNYPQEHALATKAIVRVLAIDGKNARAQAAQKDLSKLEYVWRDKVKQLKAQSLEERERRVAARLSLQVARMYAFYEPAAVDKVKEAIDRCFALWPAMPDALELLEQVAQKAGDVRIALTVFSKLAGDTRDKQAKVDLHLRIGQVLLSKLNDPAGAADAFEQAARLDPSRPDAMELASEALISNGKPAEGMAVIERHLATLKDKAAQVALRLNLADLTLKLLKDANASRGHVEAAQKIDPHNASVAYRLATINADDGNLEGLWPLIDLAVSAPRPIAERITLCELVALLCEEHGELAKAFHVLSLALPLDPSRAALVKMLCDAGEKAKAGPRLALTLRRAAQVAPPEAQATLWRALGAVLQKQDRPAESQEAWLEVQKRRPDDAEATQALAALRKALAEEPQDPRSKLEAEARRLEASAADPASAAAVYRKILELDPDSVATLKKLGSAAANLGLWEEVALVAERLMALADSPAERQEWRARLAQLYAERLNRREDAAKFYLTLLDEGNASAGVVGGLERLAAQGIRQGDISRALAPVYAGAGDYQRQVASLLVQLSAVQDRDEQKSLLSLLAETTEKRLIDERSAFDYRVRGLQLDPADSAFRAESVRLARALKAEQELTRTFTELAAKGADATLSVSLLMEAAELAEGVGAIDEAAAALRKGLDKVGDHPELLERLATLFLTARRWGEADQVIRRRLTIATTPEQKVALGLQLTQVNVDLSRPREAAAALTEAIKAGAPELEHLPRVMQLLEQGGLLRELAQTQARMIALLEAAGETDKASALSVTRARLLETALGDKAEAIRKYGEVLAQKANDADALAALENLLGDPDHREAAARAILPAYEAARDHRKQVQALAVISEACRDSLERITALKRAAELHIIHLRQPEQAFAALATAMRLAPDDAELRAAARTAAEDADALDSYAEVVEELIDGVPESVTITFHRELADVYEKKLNKQVEAISHLRAVLAVDAKHLEALRSLQRLFRAREEWAELVPIIERLAVMEGDPASRSSLDREAAVLAEQKLNDLERAATNWRQIASRDVLAREAATALDRLYGALDKPQELAFALELRRNQEGQSPQGRELAFRLAALRQNRLNDPRGALEVYRQILSEDAAHEGTREALEAWARGADAEGSAAAEILDAVLARTGDHQRRIAIREARVAHATTQTERARIASEIRAILERDLSQPESAFMNALKAFTDGLQRDEIQGELERLARITGSFGELAEIYESTVEELDAADDHRAPLIRRAAELREQLNEPEEAIRVWKMLLEALPQDRQALDSLSRLYEQSKNARSLSDVYARQAELATDPAERFELLVKTGDAWEQAGDDAQAIESLKLAFAINRSREVLLTLERLFGKSKRSLEQADVLAQLAEGAIDQPERLQFVVKRGLLLEKEGQHAEAVRAFGESVQLSKTEPQVIAGLERLLAVDGVRLEAARLLEGCFREVNDLKRLVDVLDIRLSAAEPRKRVGLLLEIANLREAVGQKSLALTARLRAFGEQPDDEEVRNELERLSADLGAFEELTAAYEDALERGIGEPLAGELWRRLAVVYGDRLSRFDLAARAWNEVLARNPRDMAVLEQLGRIFRRTSQFRELSVVMRRQLGLETNVTAQVNLLFELATLAEDTLSDKPLAATCYQAILERKPDDPNAIKLLGRILAETEAWPELAVLLGKEIQLAEARHKEEEALELLVRLGRLKLTRLGDPRGALTTFQEVLRRKPAHAGAVGALEEMARSDNPLKGEAASTLEPVFANEGEHLKLVQMLEARVAAEPAAAERAGLLRKMAEVYSQQLDNAEMAFVVSARALRELPDEATNLELALTFYKKADAEDEFAALLTEVAPRASNDVARANLYRALARVQAQADEEAEAIESWKRVMELVPTDSEAMQQIGQLYSRQGRVNELLEVLKRQLTIEEDTPRRAALLFQIGTLQEEQLKDVNSAIASFRRLLELQPDDVAALSRMERLCEVQQRWPELADVLTRRTKLVAADEQPALTFKLAVIRETKLLDKQGALDLYKDLLVANSRHEGALQRMEGLVQREPQNQQAFEILAAAFRAASDATRLAQLIENRVGVSPDVVERKSLLVELATLRDAQAEPELAYLAYYRAFKEEPNDAAIRKRLYAAGAAASSFDELVGALQAELPRIAEPADVSEVCLTIAQISEQRLDEKEQAVVFYEKARAAHEETGKKALGALDRLYGEFEFPDKQAEILDVIAGNATEPAEQVALFFRLGQLWMEQLDNPDRAAGAFEKVLEADPKHLPSLRSLEILYEQAKASDKLYRVLEAQRELVQGAERERLLGKMAVTSAEGLDDVDHSIKLYRELLEKNPRNEQAFEALTRLLERGQKADELRELLQWKLQFTVDPRELVRLNERVGRVLWQQLNKPDDAVPFFKAALERDARHKGALEALRDIFDQTNKREDLVIVLRRLIPLQEDTTGVKLIRIRLAEIISETARREEALDAARRSLEVEPHQVPELDRLNVVFTRLKAWPDAVRTLEAKVAVLLGLEEREAAAQTAFQIAEIWKGPANKLEQAGGALGRVLEIDPSNRQAYEQSLELFSKLNDWRSYAQAMDRYLPHFVTDDEKVMALRELARVQETKLGAKQVAFLQYCRALQLNAAQDEIREQVERLAEETGSYDELAAVYEQIAEDVPRGPLAERLYLTLARVQDGELDDPQAAEASLRKILEFDPTNEQALERLAAMFARRGQNKEYVVSLEQKLEAAGSIERRKEILREISRVFDEQMGNPDEAEGALVRALELEPDLETFSVLVNLQRRQNNHAAVASTLMRMRDIAPTPEDRARFQVEVAQVYERDLQDDEAAVEGYRQALEFDPANAQALASLEQLYSKLDRPAELLAVYERQIELTSDYRERVKILFRSAAIWEERYQNLANADACIEAALQVDPQNLQAIKTLERLRKSQGRWDELIGVVDRHIQLLTNPSERAELCVEMGDIFHQQLKAVDRAVTAYHQALELDARCRPAMHALGMLYERSGNWPFALDMLEREAHVLAETPEAVELWYRMGKINEDMLLDAGSAKRCFLEALRIDAAYLPAIRALKGIYELERDFESYEKALLEEARQTEEPSARARAFVAVGRYYESKEDRDQATGAYEEALKLEPDLLDAASPLADIYLGTERYDRCEVMLDIVTAQLGQAYAQNPDDPDLGRELCRRHYRLGYVAEKNGKRDKALQAFERAYQLDATYLPVLEGYGNLLVHAKRYEEAQRVYQSILVHHRGDLTDLEVAEIYWTLGDLHMSLRQFDRAQNHFEKALAIDPAHEPSLRSMVGIAEQAQQFDQAVEFRRRLVEVLDGEAKFEAAIELGAAAKDKLSDPYIAIDAYLTAHRIRQDALDVMDALYVLYRETKQGAKAAEMLEKMLLVPALQQDAQRAKRVWFALGELNRDELGELEKATKCMNAALDADWRFIDAFSALEKMLGKAKKWQILDENYKRMIGRIPKTPDTHPVRMSLWKALGDLYLNALKAPEAAVQVYKVVASGMPENVEIQELYAGLAQTQPGMENEAVEAWRRALPSTSSPGKVASALAELAARRKDYDSAWLAAQVSAGLIGDPQAGEKEILTKLTPYAKKREVAQRQLTDRLWTEHLFHPKVRGPLADLFAILFEQAGSLYKEDHGRYGIVPKKHYIDVASAQEYQIHHYRYVSRVLGMDQISVFSPFLITTRERMAKRTTEPAPDPMVGIELCHTDPVALKFGGKFFSETGQREVYYLLGRTMAFLRPELALTQRLAGERLEAVLQAAISLSVDRFRFTADLRIIDVERKKLEQHLTPQARDALARVTKEYVKVATPTDLRNFLEGAEFTATRTGAFVAGEIEPVKRMVMAETGPNFRVQPRSKIRDLLVFALGDDLHALRVAVGTNVEVQIRK